ncbi:MAG: hypothetical protein QOG43_2445 [Actinomycetota bacterium]|nr:hypothetical protein [Actinomycetota bacterium]
MRTASPPRTGIIAVGIGALAAVSMALLLPAGAGAAQTPTSPTTTKAPTLIEAVCGKLPGLLQNVTDALPEANDALTTARAAVDGKRTAMTDAMEALAAAVVAHLGVLDAGGNPAATGATLKAQQALYVDSVVAWSKARTQLFDGEQQVVFGELQQTLIDSVQGRACP